MNRKFYLLMILSLFFISRYAYAVDQKQVEQVTNITGIQPGRVAKMAEAIEKMDQAVRLAIAKKFGRALAVLDEITTSNGFLYDDDRGARITKIDVFIHQGNYAKAKDVMEKLNSERLLDENFVAYVRALDEFSRTKDPEVLLLCVEDYKKTNPNIIPPQTHDFAYLARTVRLFEMANEIDQALALVEQYFVVYFPKDGFKREPSGIVKKQQEGLLLLKESLLRDKEESKNIYAQELINTTDYFGFV